MTFPNHRKTRASSHNEVESLKHVGRFPSLRAAGTVLAEALLAHETTGSAIVLGIATAGLPVGREVANGLSLPFDFVVIKRLLLPRGPGSELCAVTVGGLLFVDEEVEGLRATPSVDQFITVSLVDLSHRTELYRAARPPIEIADRRVLLVDCAARTGWTVRIAIRALRKLGAARITVALPVSSPEGCALIAPLTDELVCLAQPQNFGNAAVWYEDFSRPDDESIHKLLDSD